MARTSYTAAGTALLLTFAVGCTQAGTPLSPTSVRSGLDQAADGSTLKVNAPDLLSPVGGVETDSLEPTLAVGNVSARFTETPPLQYRFEVYRADGSGPILNSFRVDVDPDGNTSWQIPDAALELDTPYRWRARAELNNNFGPWSDFGEFRTLAYRGLVPRPPNGNWPSNGPAVVAYIAHHFPEYLVRTSTNRRIANMEFLRDRIIEAGVCGGLDVARNLKRGVGPHSIDAIAWRTGGRVEVIDIASAYDDGSRVLSLKWSIVGGPPGYDPLPDHPGC